MLSKRWESSHHAARITKDWRHADAVVAFQGLRDAVPGLELMEKRTDDESAVNSLTDQLRWTQVWPPHVPVV